MAVWSMKYLILSTLFASWLRPLPTIELCLRSGCIQGTTLPRHRQYLAIPYAYSHRSQRFQSPLTAAWDTTRVAQDEHVKCPQRYTSSLVLGQEDCLTLNVFTPSEVTEPLPVMVYFHGGGYREGSSSPFLYGPDYLIEKGVIVVSANYRLEVLGFLCLGIKEAPGNMGLKDQVEALKWVQTNIKFFGGDPNNVTIFGESAGASSVAYHILSPMSKGLFHKAIMQSGTALIPWLLQRDPLKTASQLALQMGFKANDPKELYNFFMTKTAEELLGTRVPREKGNGIMSESIFVPCIEKPIDGVDAFLLEDPYNILVKGNFNKVPTIIGYNSAEGYMFAAKENDTTIEGLDIAVALPRDLKLNDNTRDEIGAKVKSMYKIEGKITKEIMPKVSRFYGDVIFKFPVIATADLMMSKTQVFAYQFAYDGLLNVAKMYFGYGMHPGATHADDLFYMFKPEFLPANVFEKMMVNRVTTLWTNFAKYGDPSPTTSSLLPQRWRPIDPRDPKVLVIDRQLSTAPLWDEPTLFWNHTYALYRRID